MSASKKPGQGNNGSRQLWAAQAQSRQNDHSFSQIQPIIRPPREEQASLKRKGAEGHVFKLPLPLDRVGVSNRGNGGASTAGRSHMTYSARPPSSHLNRDFDGAKAYQPEGPGGGSASGQPSTSVSRPLDDPRYAFGSVRATEPGGRSAGGPPFATVPRPAVKRKAAGGGGEKPKNRSGTLHEQGGWGGGEKPKNRLGTLHEHMTPAPRDSPITLLDSDDEDLAEVKAHKGTTGVCGRVVPDILRGHDDVGRYMDNTRVADEVEITGTATRRQQRKCAQQAELNIAEMIAAEKGEDPILARGKKQQQQSSGQQQLRFTPESTDKFSTGGGAAARSRLRKLRLERPLIYPDGDPEAVTITSEDLLRLRPNEFLNDSVIDLMMKRLQQRIVGKPGAERFHFFSSFFYNKLCENGGGAHASSQAHKSVQRWTSKKKVVLFEKDFIFIPINQNLHWSLAIVCNPWAATSITPTDPAEACILLLDSLGDAHRNVETKLRLYLKHEWIAKEHKRLGTRRQSTDGFDDDDPSGADRFTEKFFPHVRCDVPQQSNYHDCGLFIIKFMEHFVEDVMRFSAKLGPYYPKFEFSTRSDDGFPFFLNRQWFKPDDAGSAMRSQIRRIIFDLAWGGSGDGKLADDANLVQREAKPTTVDSESDGGDDESEVVLCASGPRGSQETGGAQRTTAKWVAKATPPGSPLLMTRAEEVGRGRGQWVSQAARKDAEDDSDEDFNITTNSSYHGPPIHLPDEGELDKGWEWEGEGGNLHHGQGGGASCDAQDAAPRRTTAAIGGLRDARGTPSRCVAEAISDGNDDGDQGGIVVGGTDVDAAVDNGVAGEVKASVEPDAGVDTDTPGGVDPEVGTDDEAACSDDLVDGSSEDGVEGTQSQAEEAEEVLEEAKSGEGLSSGSQRGEKEYVEEFDPTSYLGDADVDAGVVNLVDDDDEDNDGK